LLLLMTTMMTTTTMPMGYFSFALQLRCTLDSAEGDLHQQQTNPSG